jgi:hypothetical protein
MGRREEDGDMLIDRSPDNGLLTPAMKLARPVLSKTFAHGIEKAYGRAL